ncbi:hypothetical protein NF865_06990 [Thermococcus aggregans]|uniref:Uncharacterized protein n=1 Tax=Thermococcus aggregans TaxID=110163 RepID=A0A9E7MWF0_THEAG|nr:hypothetical protein [Thermococcus aggregans]USS40082.1 hypothetical protein NF865_06990 [Thermococcus aggregans]
MKMTNLIQALLLAAGLLLILLSLTYAVDYQLNKEDPYFEDPDAVEITLGTSAFFLMLGGTTLLFARLYRENANSLVLNVAVTFLLVFEMWLGYEIFGISKSYVSCACTYQRPEVIPYIGLILFVLTAATVPIIWARIIINQLKSKEILSG